MGVAEIISTIILSLIGVIGYFLKNVLGDVKELKEQVNESKSKLAVIENDYTLKHTHLSEKFDELSHSIKELVNEIKLLNIELLKKKP